ncbi:hypothetical protein A6301_10100 [Pectobacterium sp. IFB5596]|nr:hypothetical protein [Pectobacterium sp. IFB5596]
MSTRLSCKRWFFHVFSSFFLFQLPKLGRSVRDLIELVSALQAKGIHFRSLTDSIDTSTPAGRFFFHVMSALAEMERELIVERKRLMTPDVLCRAEAMLATGATRFQVANVVGVSEKTIYKYFPVGEKDSVPVID